MISRALSQFHTRVARVRLVTLAMLLLPILLAACGQGSGGGSGY